MIEDPCVYSHGGGAADGRLNGNGYPIDTTGATKNGAIFITIDVGSADVELHCHPGPLREDGTLEERDWMDTSNGGWHVEPGPADGKGKVLPYLAPYWRTCVKNVAGGGSVVSKVPRLYAEGHVARPLPKNPGSFFANPYDR